MTHASVFSGIGGPEVAAAMLGWQNLFHCEINPFGRKVLQYWFPKAKSYEDITKTDFTPWRGKVNVLTGGFPCQPFSYAGQRRGADDDRYLWPHMHRCINEVRPDWFVAENVGGILSMVEQGCVHEVASQVALFGEEDVIHRYEYRGTFTIERICRDIEADGYEVQPVLIPACAVGAPHRRDRVFIVTRQGAEILSGQTGRGERHAPVGRHRLSSVQGNAPDPDGDRGLQVHEHLEPEQPDGAKPFSDGRERNATDTADGRISGCNGISQQCDERIARQSVSDSEPSCSRNQQGWFGKWADRGVAGEGRWSNFPTVSPVHRGNDGIPFSLDCLAISPKKWQTESIRAYGNAIVPQVIYEIYRAIEQVENIQHQTV